jgi:hypothetical protein
MHGPFEAPEHRNIPKGICSYMFRAGTPRNVKANIPACSGIPMPNGCPPSLTRTDWDEHGRDERYLLPAGVQIERGRALLNSPGDVAVDDICDYVCLSIEKEDERFATERRAAVERLVVFHDLSWADKRPWPR